MNWRSTKSTKIENEVGSSKINMNKMIALLAICLSLTSTAFSQSSRPTAQPGRVAHKDVAPHDFGLRAKSFVSEIRPVALASVGSNGLHVLVTTKLTKSPSVKPASQGNAADKGIRRSKKLKSKSDKRRSQGIGDLEEVRWPKKLKSKSVNLGSRSVEPPPPRPPAVAPKSSSVNLGSRAAGVERFRWPNKPHPPSLKPGLRIKKQR